MKRSNSNLSEVDSLLHSAEKILLLENEAMKVSASLRNIQEDAKSRIRRRLDIVPNSKDDAETLKELRAIYRDELPRGDHEINMALERETELREQYEKASEEITRLLKDIGPKVTTLCRQIALDAGQRYQELVAEIAKKLFPYCEGDQSTAEFLAAQAPAAATMFRHTLYTTPENKTMELIYVLRNAREVICAAESGSAPLGVR